MKFLLISRMKDMFVMLPVEQQARVMEGAAAFIEKYKKAGICKEIYSVPSMKGAVSIWEIDSAEKGAGLFVENPASPFQDIEMYVLSDFDTQMKAQADKYQELLGKK